MKKVVLCLLLLTAMVKTSAQNTEMARGADVSWCTEMEADGRKFYNAQGTGMELMTLMKEIGMTAIRLRVWVNPQKYGYGAWCDKADVVAKAKRAHAAGLDLMIDFHYSDFFCDPGTQNTPKDWADYSVEQLKTAVGSHTKDVLQALKNEGIEPKWVQVGNEINNGMLNPLGKIDWSKSGTARYTSYVAISNAGYEAVKEVMPNAYVIIHLAGTENASWFFRDFRDAGGKFDMIGLSHYPTEDEWNSTAASATHSNINAAKSVKQAASSFGVPVMICETGFDVGKPVLASTIMKDLFDRMKAIPQCAGIFYWEPQVDGQWKPAYYNKVGWRAYGKGAFTAAGRPTAALAPFSGKSGETGSFPSELKVYNKDGNAVLTTLPQTSDGIYTGRLIATEAWQNFHVVDEYSNTWYGTDPADKTVVSSAEGHWNFWIDSEQTGAYDLTVNLSTMRWTHAYNAEASAGISNMEASPNAPVIWYDLKGRSVKAPSKGVYLMKRGKQTVKVNC